MLGGLVDHQIGVIVARARPCGALSTGVDWQPAGRYAHMGIVSMCILRTCWWCCTRSARLAMNSAEEPGAHEPLASGKVCGRTVGRGGFERARVKVKTKRRYGRAWAFHAGRGETTSPPARSRQNPAQHVIAEPASRCPSATDDATRRRAIAVRLRLLRRPSCTSALRCAAPALPARLLPHCIHRIRSACCVVGYMLVCHQHRSDAYAPGRPETKSGHDSWLWRLPCRRRAAAGKQWCRRAANQQPPIAAAWLEPDNRVGPPQNSNSVRGGPAPMPRLKREQSNAVPDQCA